MADSPVIVWLRDDLRLADHPALHAAAAIGAPALCLYIHDESPGLGTPGGAARWWLHHSLAALAQSLRGIGGRLDILRGSARTLVPALADAAGARGVFWTRRYRATEIAVDSEIKAALGAQGREAKSFNGQLLAEPFALKTTLGGPYRVFTPFWRALSATPISAPLPAPARLRAAAWPAKAPTRLDLADLRLLPENPDWAGGLRAAWRPGEPSARASLDDFLSDRAATYPADRDRPALPATSRLSPHLRFGEISPRTIWHAARHAAASGAVDAAAIDKFLSELGWRDFSWHLLFHNPDLATRNVDARFDAFPWRDDAAGLAAWRRGRTGYPIVDAGMRELWTTGYMHNRVRMIAASFLIKHLLIDWRAGESWFRDTLCDADPASNAANWQWVAGSGADAAPYFRIFNPILQGEKFDADGAYVRRWIPELARAPNAFVHKPWAAPRAVPDEAGVRPGVDYPAPVVDHAAARARALAAWRVVSSGGSP